MCVFAFCFLCVVYVFHYYRTCRNFLVSPFGSVNGFVPFQLSSNSEPYESGVYTHTPHTHHTHRTHHAPTTHITHTAHTMHLATDGARGKQVSRSEVAASHTVMGQLLLHSPIHVLYQLERERKKRYSSSRNESLDVHTVLN